MNSVDDEPYKLLSQNEYVKQNLDLYLQNKKKRNIQKPLTQEKSRKLFIWEIGIKIQRKKLITSMINYMKHYLKMNMLRKI